MDKNEATMVIWQALSCYCEDSVSSDEDALQEVDDAWQIILKELGNLE